MTEKDLKKFLTKMDLWYIMKGMSGQEIMEYLHDIDANPEELELAEAYLFDSMFDARREGR